MNELDPVLQIALYLIVGAVLAKLFPIGQILMHLWMEWRDRRADQKRWHDALADTPLKTSADCGCIAPGSHVYLTPDEVMEVPHFRTLPDRH